MAKNNKIRGLGAISSQTGIIESWNRVQSAMKNATAVGGFKSKYKTTLVAKNNEIRGLGAISSQTGIIESWNRVQSAMKNATAVGGFKRKYKTTQSRTGDSLQDGDSVGDKMDVCNITTGCGSSEDSARHWKLISK